MRLTILEFVMDLICRTAKLIGIIALIFLFSICGSKQPEVERLIEDGVEVVINHLEPYIINGVPTNLHIEEELTIDTERDEIAEIGVTDIRGFDVDSKGNIYFFQERESDENVVYKFDKAGNFVDTFGKRGQGPGEMQYPACLSINKKDELPIQDGNRPLLFIYDSNGNLVEEIKVTRLDLGGMSSFNYFPLDNKNYLAYGFYFDTSTKHRMDMLCLVNSEFEKLKELDICDYGKGVAFSQQKKKYTPRVFICQVSDLKIYVGHENRGYEILIFDLAGKLTKKIRKEYNPVGVPDDFKEYWHANIGPYKNRLDFPDHMPPFHYFFLDDEGRLYVKTYEDGEKKNEYIHDIFNSDGIFIGRKSMAGYGNKIYPGMALNRAKAKNKHLYCIREKVSGFKELVVYKMKWE